MYVGHLNYYNDQVSAHLKGEITYFLDFLQ